MYPRRTDRHVTAGNRLTPVTYDDPPVEPRRLMTDGGKPVPDWRILSRPEPRRALTDDRKAA